MRGGLCQGDDHWIRGVFRCQWGFGVGSRRVGKTDPNCTGRGSILVLRQVVGMCAADRLANIDIWIGQWSGIRIGLL